MRDTGVLIGSFKFHEIVGIETDLVFFAARLFSLEVGLDDDPGGIHALHGACPLGQDHVSGIPCHDGLHPRPHQGSLGLDQGDGLALHVRAHQGPVRVIMLQKRNQGRGDAHDLLRRQVHILNLVRRDHDKIPAVPG